VKAILKQNLSILLLYLLLFVTALLMIIINSKLDTHLFFNSFHNSFFDVFFYWATYFGDGIAVILVFIILLTVKYRYALILALSTGISAIITQGLKHLVFPDVVRPKLFFKGLNDLYFVPGVENMYNNSFPSGHTTCAFAMYMSLAFIVKKKTYKILLFFTAVLIGYSRIYLSQHFLEDVTAGSFIGTVTAIFIYFVYYSKINSWM